MELSDVRWRKSSRSGDNGGHCVELGVLWRKSSRSGDNAGNCVELAGMSASVAVRDSKDPGGGVLVFTREQFGHFTERLKASRPV